jgi:tetratricopeptide (TPR) repeat protein
LTKNNINFYTDSTIGLEDTLLFYYSGHGVPDAENDVYLSTSEIDPDQPYRQGFSFYELAKMMRSLSKKIVAILDCCYSGAAGISKGSEEDVAKIANASIISGSNSLAEGEGVCLLASSQANQEAYALKEENHSVFTYYLIKGLKGDEGAIDDYGYVTADSLARFIYTKIMSLPREKRPRQKPIRKMEMSGEIVIAHYPQYSKKKLVDQLEGAPQEYIVKQYMEKKEYQKALEYYKRIIKNPSQADLWINKGVVHHKLGNNVEALKCFDVAIDLDPTNALALRNKGITLGNLKMYYDENYIWNSLASRIPTPTSQNVSL